MLALDHSRQEPWGPLHGVTVACFLLQHPSRLPAPDRGRAWAIVRGFVDGGLAAVADLTDAVRRANSHRARGALPILDVPPSVSGPFEVTIVDVAQDGTFPAAGFAARVRAWAQATLDAHSLR
ncbi:hypothetical protein GCM10017786_23360 [Amycolatopsis deserti]|uniref:Uncharacterized protein n=1 Tax=Amycolatopsis deserti TaxID=185696 RepID=A0ABQ3IPC7_9PSEU|nr:hypothetical protein GCM10017786_23360 [Amycolatopsis deserti]